ncbi:unnamed protein product [Plutella xylostella]|uniref:(diamondback moth) hypothetical protein n=1 Tax=Plutella xylostella TaxID=51655 RepID=A0A8S4G5G4_PLUXY|nr:unnamed protein product [Plutella xylostella]
MNNLYITIILVIMSATSQGAVLNGTRKTKTNHVQQTGSGKLLCKCPIFDSNNSCESAEEIIRLASVAHQLAQRSKCAAQESMRFRRDSADRAQKINKELFMLCEEMKKMAYDVGKLAKCYMKQQDNDCTAGMPMPCQSIN